MSFFSNFAQTFYFFFLFMIGRKATIFFATS